MNLVEAIGAAGVVGCGGAGYPAQGKLKGSFEYFIINGAECEPLLRTDRYLMLNKAREIVQAAATIKHEMNIPHCFIALKEHYADEVRALEAAIKELDAPVELFKLDSFYPAGDKQVIVYEVTGIVIPPAGSTGRSGVLLFNVGTVYEIYHALLGRPFIYKYLTVTGEVRKPVIVKAPIGTSMGECVALAGGAKIRDYRIVAGGPMMGKPVTEDMPVTKTTSGILVLPAGSKTLAYGATDVRHMLNRARSACIQCSYCTQLCPRHLLGHPLEPHKIMRKLATGEELSSLLGDKDIQGAALCCDCGICELYACPMELQPRRVNGLIKAELKKAGIRYQAEDKVYEPLPGRHERRAPTGKVAARADVWEYNDYVIRDLVKAEPKTVEIPMKMHSGAPCTPVVAVGDSVRAGDLIGTSSEGVGTNIHASICGRVTAVSQKSVTVETER